MTVFMVSYDLRKPGQNYNGLIEALRDVDHVKALDSLWFIRVNQTAIQVRNAIRSYLDVNDRVLVVEIRRVSDWAGYNASPSVLRWLNRVLLVRV